MRTMLLVCAAFLAAVRASSAGEVPVPDGRREKPDKAYYKRLYAACRASPEGASCCRSSVRRMEKNGWRSAAGPTLAESGCPEGTHPDTLKCMGSLRWCAPGAAAEAPKKAAGPVGRPPFEYYLDLRARCASKTSPGCCEASLARMESKGARLAEVGEGGVKSCPEGTTPDMLRCADSYQWCAPADPLGGPPRLTPPGPTPDPGAPRSP